MINHVQEVHKGGEYFKSKSSEVIGCEGHQKWVFTLILCCAAWSWRLSVGCCGKGCHWFLDEVWLLFLCLAGKVYDSYPFFEETGVLDVIMPKKEPLIIAKWWALKKRKMQLGFSYYSSCCN